MTFAFRFALDLLKRGKLPIDVLNFFITLGIKCTNLRLSPINSVFAALIVAAIERSQIATVSSLTAIVKLVTRGDIFFEKVEDLLSLESVKPLADAITDPIASFWVRAIRDELTVPIENEVFQSFRDALVFGDVRVLQKFMGVLLRQGTVEERQQYVELLQFALMSPEVPPAIAVSITSIIEGKFGEQINGPSTITIPKLRESVAEFAVGFSEQPE
jgi:hypothetical protein